MIRFPHGRSFLLILLTVAASVHPPQANAARATCLNAPCWAALTFDDGPHPRLTPKILEILEDHHVPATFFVVGRSAAAHPDLLQRMAGDGDEIGNHTWAHADIKRQSADQQAQAIDQTTHAIQQAVPGPVRLFRPPYGLYNRNVLDQLAERHMSLVLWTADDEDYRGWPAHRLEDNVEEEVHPGVIILMHDIHPNTVQALPQEIEWLQAHGFELVTVSTLMTHIQPQPARYPLFHPAAIQTP